MSRSGKKRVGVVGSGFGGSIAACRLAEAGGFEVHVLERGARYGLGEFPRQARELERLIWDPSNGNIGLLEYRSFTRSHIDVMTGAGLGGGSLIYSNVLYRMPEAFFDDWPGGIRRETLDPYYDRALDVLEATPYPKRADWPYWAATPKSRALAEVAAKIAASPRGHPPVRLEWPPLAVQFGQEPGRELVNRSGVRQLACVMCGECNIGCNTHSKNTLDLNYLARAERLGVTLRTNAAVRSITPRVGGGFDVAIYDPRASSPAEREAFDVVVLAAGSLGSTELVLRMRAEMRDKVKLSKAVGTRWSPNGDLLGFVRNADFPLEPSKGPVITGALHVQSASYPDGFPAGEWIEDGGGPALLAWCLLGRAGGLGARVAAAEGFLDYLVRKLGVPARPANIGGDLRAVLFADRWWTSNMLLMLGMGRDRATGTLDLSEPDGSVHLSWEAGEGELHYARTRATMERVAEALGGVFVENPLDDALDRYVSVHPVGGLPLGDDPSGGAVNAKTAELFGCKDLYVLDGSIVPGPVGPNPALTIAALAEMFAERLCHA